MEYKERRNWVVRVYDNKYKVLKKWTIKNRTEREAYKEAEADVLRISNQDDWTMTEE